MPHSRPTSARIVRHLSKLKEPAMSFTLPTVEQMIYRVMRLRRLIALSAAIPLLFLLAVSFAAPDFLSAMQASFAVMGVVAMVLLHTVFFPNVTLETLAVAIAGTAFALM